MALLVDLTVEAAESLLRLDGDLRARGDDLTDVVALSGQRVDAGVHRNTQSPARQVSMLPRARLRRLPAADMGRS